MGLVRSFRSLFRPKRLGPKRLKSAKPARSVILERMLADKVERKGLPVEFPRLEPRNPLTLVIARYQEDVQWLMTVPEDVKIVLYNKGLQILDPKLLERIDVLTSLPNCGREPDTYLHHLQQDWDQPARAWTVFTQADPFPHSPDFLRLLDFRNAWSDVQTLSS